MVAAPSSGSGKSVITMAVLRALRRRGVDLRSAKSGPDFIDPAFHAAASGAPCVNLDAWAMRPDLIYTSAAGEGLLVVEAAMGLFDGAADGSGSAADLAAMLGLPVVLVVDCARQSQSVAALVQGFSRFRADVTVAGVIANNMGSPRHGAMIERALDGIGMPCFGMIARSEALVLPSRHLGLVGAGETDALDGFLDGAADVIEATLDLERLAALSCQLPPPAPPSPPLPPPGQRIAVARDAAFAFVYPHLLDGWRNAGAEVLVFSPLAGAAVPDDADAIFLPGGYPELYAAEITANASFLARLRSAAERGVPIYGECGGYMVLGDALVDGEGTSHRMAGLLPVVTSFAQRKRHLGYRRARLVQASAFLGAAGQSFATHEFHYTTLQSGAEGQSVFEIEDALGERLGTVGHTRGSVTGSYLHIIDRRIP